MRITRRVSAAIAAVTLIGVAVSATPAYAGTDIGWIEADRKSVV